MQLRDLTAAEREAWEAVRFWMIRHFNPLTAALLLLEPKVAEQEEHVTATADYIVFQPGLLDFARLLENDFQLEVPDMPKKKWPFLHEQASDAVCAMLEQDLERNEMAQRARSQVARDVRRQTELHPSQKTPLRKWAREMPDQGGLEEMIARSGYQGELPSAEQLISDPQAFDSEGAPEVVVVYLLQKVADRQVEHGQAGEAQAWGNAFLVYDTAAAQGKGDVMPRAVASVLNQRPPGPEFRLPLMANVGELLKRRGLAWAVRGPEVETAAL